MSVYKKHNGKWYCQFMVKGERVHKLLDGATGLESAKDLELAEKFKLRQMQNGLLPRKEKKCTLQQAIKLYLNYSQLHKKDYQHDISKTETIKTFFGNKNLDEIMTNDVENFITYLKDKKNLSNATINRYLSALKKIYNIAISNEMINKSPCKNIKQLKENNNKIRYLTNEEEKRLFEEIPERIKPIIIMALHQV